MNPIQPHRKIFKMNHILIFKKGYKDILILIFIYHPIWNEKF
jgi:hypothetical protein